MHFSNNVPAKCAIWVHRPYSGSAAPRVLVVDDCADTADAISMILSVEGFAAEVAYRGLTAIEVAHSWQPDIVVLDVCMPDLSGFDVAIRLRRQSSTAGVLIVGHSALSTEHDFEQARVAGFDAYCAKPLDASKLAPLLRYLCRVSYNGKPSGRHASS